MLSLRKLLGGSILGLLAGLMAAAGPLDIVGPATAAELLVMERDGCPWCERFDAEIAPIYPKTTEGKRAPLRRIDIHAPLPADLKDIRLETFTPTFVLVEDGREIGRIRGYPGEEFFWFMLSELIAKLDKPQHSGLFPAGPAAPDPIGVFCGDRTPQQGSRGLPSRRGATSRPQRSGVRSVMLSMCRNRKPLRNVSATVAANVNRFHNAQLADCGDLELYESECESIAPQMTGQEGEGI